MAGTLTISTLSDGTNSTSATNCIQGSAKAWINFNGTATTIRASYNVSSITRNGTGSWTVSFTNALVDANYSTNVSVGTTTTGGEPLLGGIKPKNGAAPAGTFIYSTTQVGVICSANPASGGAYTDASDYVCVSVFR